MWIGDKLNGGKIVLMCFTHYHKTVAIIELPSGERVKYLIKERGEYRNELYCP